MKSPIANMPDVMPKGLVSLDADLRVFSADSLFYSSFQVTPAETEGRFLKELGTGQWSDPALHEHLRKAVAEEHAFVDHQVTFDFPNGLGFRSILVHGGTTGNTEHPGATVMLGFEDNTARYMAQEVIRVAEVRYRRLFQTAKDGILILDAHTGQVIDANAFMEGLVGLETGELLGKQLYEIGMFKDIDQNKAAFRELQRARYIRYEHLPVQNRRGGTVEVEFIANVYLEGDRLVAQCNVRDISERVRLEKQVAQQAMSLADEARSKDQFLAMLSHELRNPLAPIRSAVHLLKLQRGKEMDVLEREALDIIERQVGNMTELVSELLEVSRVINGRIHLTLRTVDMHQVLEHAMQTVAPLFVKHRHSHVLNACPDPLWVQADPRRLEEVFVNLLNNAAKYTPDGGHIEVACSSSEEQVCIEVKDDGMGMQAEMLPHVFDLFTQADRSLHRSSGGLGIGLSLAHRLVALHGGSITAQSPGLGEGSTFTVKFPLIGAPESVASGSPVKHDIPVDGMRVLVVDDNVDMATILTSMLRHKGYTVRTAYTGPEGLRIAQEWAPRIVLLDIGLPGLDGYEVARRLRIDPERSTTRLIALTGYGQGSDIALTREAGFDAHLVKPYSFDELEQLMLRP